MTPKHHMLFHVLNFLQWSSDLAGYGLNPVIESCAQDEDYVGRLARICPEGHMPEDTAKVPAPSEGGLVPA